MTKITKEVCKNLRATMMAEMNEIAKKYGMEASFGNMRFTSDEIGVKLSLKSKDKVEAEKKEVNVRLNGKIVVGSYIQHPARKQPLVVTDVTASYVSVRGANGGNYRIKMSEALRYAI